MAEQLVLPELKKLSVADVVRRIDEILFLPAVRCPRCGRGGDAATVGDTYVLCDSRKGGCGRVYAR